MKEVLKLALNALEAMQMYAAAEHKGLLIICDEAITAIKAALAQQEPVAYLCENAVGHKYFRWKKPSSTYKPIALYTTPPQRTWVGLTVDELIDLERKHLSHENLTRAIEAKLKEKNA